MSGSLTVAAPYGACRPGAGRAGDAWRRPPRGGRCGSGRTPRRPSARPCRRRAAGRSGRSAAGSTVPDWKRSSSANSTSIAAALPSGSRSRVTSGLSVMPGSGGSTVYPQRKAPNSWPGSCRTRAPVSPASRSADAADHASGGSSSRSIAGSTSPWPVSTGRLATASTATASPAAGRPAHAAADAPRRQGSDEGGAPEGQAEHHHRHGPGARAEGQCGAGGGVAEHGVHDRGGVLDRVDAHAEHHADDDEGDGERPVRPPGHHGPGEPGDEQDEPGGDQPARHHVVAPGRRGRRVHVAHVVSQ